MDEVIVLTHSVFLRHNPCFMRISLVNILMHSALYICRLECPVTVIVSADRSALTVYSNTPFQPSHY